MKKHHRIYGLLSAGILLALGACATAPSFPAGQDKSPQITSTAKLKAEQAVRVSRNGDISFSDVVANPGDPALNLAYAKQQARKGNLLRAISTMERLLLAEPAWDAARVYYMVLLDKIGDQSAARRQVELLEQRPLSPNLRRRVSRYKARLAKTTDSFKPLL